MNRSLRIRLVLFALLIATLAVTSLLSLPRSAEAACTYTNCGNWLWNGCCSAGTRQYQYRQCCSSSGTTCCFQYRCTTAACAT
jgi:hypothetical protein